MPPPAPPFAANRSRVSHGTPERNSKVFVGFDPTLRGYYERIGAVMDSGSRTYFDRALSRRQFGWIVGGGAMATLGL